MRDTPRTDDVDLHYRQMEHGDSDDMMDVDDDS
jgi:hypothetical protein